jgi:tetratricopeptide (TPR) repeat protein
MIQQQEDTGFVETILPWIVTGAALLVYLLTLNHWVNIGSLITVAKVTGWDFWSPTLQGPLLYVITLPFRWLPQEWQPVALNGLAAVCASGALGLLTYSVALLPHDRTRDQRQREHSEFSLLTIKTAWIPPVLAAVAFAFQLTCWENATAYTGESLNLLLFAYVIRCLLEYRLEQQDYWLTRAAFVFGLGMTNTWEMVGYLPALLVALAWIKGKGFLDRTFLLKMAGFGAAGLLLYLLLPLIELGSGKTPLTFWQMVKYELSTQKSLLLSFPKSRILMCGLTSLLPVVVLSIRWPSTMGDVSIIGGLVGQFAFRLVHTLFLATCVWVMFDPPFSPRALGMGLPFLTLYYLTALSIGYFSGYFLLVFGTENERTRRRQATATRWLYRLLSGLVWAALPLVPAALCLRNYPVLQANNGTLLRHLGTNLAESLPSHDAIVLSDDPFCLMLTEAVQSRNPSGAHHVYVDTRSLKYHVYQRTLARHYPQRWPDFLKTEMVPEPIDSPTLTLWLLALSRTNEIYYLHPSFGFYFESLYPKSRALAFQLLPYPSNVIKPPAMTAPEVASNQTYRLQVKTDLDALLKNAPKNRKDVSLSDVDYVTGFYSRTADAWGVQLQRDGYKAEAGPWFDMARELNTENVAALINLKARRPPGVKAGQENDEVIPDLLRRYGAWDVVLRENGPLDEAKACTALGQVFAHDHIRQAAQEFLRVRELDPGYFDARLWLIDLYLRGQWPERALEEVQQARIRPATQPLSSTNLVELVRLEAWCQYALTNTSGALQILENAEQQFPKEPTLPKTRYDILLLQKRFDDALVALNRQLQLDAGNTAAQLNKSALLIQLKQSDQALPILDQLLQRQPKNEPARMNRALANLQAGKLDAAEADYKALLEIQPNSFFAYYGLGDVADRRKDAAAAAKYFRLFLQYVSPDNDEIPRVKERLKALESRKSGG